MSYGLPTPEEFARRRAGNTQQYAPARPVEPQAYASGPGSYRQAQRALPRAIEPSAYASGPRTYSQAQQLAAPRQDYHRSQAPSPSTDRDYFVRARQTQTRPEPRHDPYSQMQSRQEALRRGNYVDNSRQADWERDLTQFRRQAAGHADGDFHRSSAYRIQRQESVAARWDQESHAHQQSFQRAAGGQDDVGRSRMAADLAARRRH